MTHKLSLETAGTPLQEANNALIMVHGRGGSALDILTLAEHLQVEGFALVAPEASNHSWYPYSFMAPAAQNEPWLSSALDILAQTVQTIVEGGIKPENIFFFGFSQGACLTLEFVARHGQHYGGVVAIIGGVIGDAIDKNKYSGDLAGTPIFLSTSHPDFHVPIERVYDSAQILRDMQANVTVKVYENYGHTIHPEQIEWANQLVFNP